MQENKIIIDQDLEEPDKFVAVNEKAQHLFCLIGREKATLKEINDVFSSFRISIDGYAGAAHAPFKLESNILHWRESADNRYWGIELNEKGQLKGDLLKGRSVAELYQKKLDRAIKNNQNRETAASYRAQLKKLICNNEEK